VEVDGGLRVEEFEIDVEDIKVLGLLVGSELR
jgi:hypothetical protein